MKLYQPHYDNGESWSDSHHWTSKEVFHYYNDAEDEILSKGYVKDTSGEYFKNPIYVTPDESDNGFAYIDELEVQG
ncbi:hypothetical protein ETI08_03590 [Macrococcoides goetzii]|nr:hypothetical protein [Macrococcus goetzii]TDM48234.1 hypothetical protein ETI08_03590 [Macrococcus goetzii]